MAIPATVIWEVESGASDTLNGGGFDPSQTAGMFADGAATVANTSAPVFTSASYNFVAGDVGAWVFIASGTNWTPGWYKIASVAANAATLSAAIGAAFLLTLIPSTVVGSATTASPTGATWSIDYSQQTAAQFAYTDLASVGAGSTVSSALKPFAKQQVGNIMVVTGGTNFTTGYYVIQSVAAGVATVAGAAAMTTGVGVSGTGGQGGAMASPGGAGAVMVAGNDLYIKSGTYTVTSASSNVAAGCLTLPAGATTANTTKCEGYQTVRGDFGTRPIIIADGVITTFTLVTTGTNSIFTSLEINGNSRTSSRGINTAAAQTRISRCIIKNCTNNAITGASSSLIINCEGTGCATQPVFGSGLYFGCVAHDNTVTGFSMGATAAHCINCISVNNTGASSDGFAGSAAAITFFNCTAYGNGRHGFSFTAGAFREGCINCLAVNSGGFGFTVSAASDSVYLTRCAGYNNTSGNVDTASIAIPQQLNFAALSADPFVSAAGNNFALNATAGAGNTARQGGFPGAFSGLSTTGHIDIGAAQEGGVTVADMAAIAALILTTPANKLNTDASGNVILATTGLDTVLAADLAAVPAANASIKSVLSWLFMLARNKFTQTATTATLKKDDGTTVATAAVSDNGTTFTRDEYT